MWLSDGMFFCFKLFEMKLATSRGWVLLQFALRSTQFIILTEGQTSESSSEREDANFAWSSQGGCCGSVCPFVSFLVSWSKSDWCVKNFYIFNISEKVTYF